MIPEAREKIAELITSAFGLVAALSWNGAVLAIFERIFGKAKSLWAMILYAIIVTIIAVYVSIKISKFAAKTKE